MNVVQFKQTNLADVALNLRKLADWVDSLPAQDLSAIIIFGRNTQDVNVYGFGQRTSGLEMQGWLQRATFHVSGNVSRASEDSPGPAA